MPPPISLNLSYFYQSPPGILKLAQLILGITIMICVGDGSARSYGAYANEIGFLWFVIITAFLNTIVMSAIYLLRIPETVTNIPWIPAEMIYSAFWLLMYFVAAIIAATIAKGSLAVAFGFASFFAFVQTALYGTDGFLYFRFYKQGNITDTTGPASQNAETA